MDKFGQGSILAHDDENGWGGMINGCFLPVIEGLPPIPREHGNGRDTVFENPLRAHLSSTTSFLGSTQFLLHNPLPEVEECCPFARRSVLDWELWDLRHRRIPHLS